MVTVGKIELLLVADPHRELEEYDLVDNKLFMMLTLILE